MTVAAAIAGLSAFSSVLTGLFSARAVTAETHLGVCEAEVSGAIAAIINQPQFRNARWGIRVETLGTSSTLPRLIYNQEGDRLFVPASNVKLLTTAAALDRLGADFRIRTSVYASNTDPNGAELRLVGRGDPSLSDDDLADLARQVSDRGIRQVASLDIDDRYFRSDAINPNWEWEDVQAGYGAPATSLILNRNEIRVVAYPGRVGQPVRIEWLDDVDDSQWQIVNQTTTVASGGGFTWVGRDLSRPILYVYGQRAIGAPPDVSAISIPNPSAYGLRQFRSALEEAGIRVLPGAIADQATPALTSPTLPSIFDSEVASVLSPQLSNLLVDTNQSSENVYAEALLRQVGVVGANPIPASPLRAGLDATKDALAILGLDPNSYVLVDGAGLARQNLISPATFVELLQIMAQHPDAAVYRRSLAEAGVSGTLRNRFRNTAVAGRFLGKTGGLTGIASLSGYLTPLQFEPLVVSIIVSHSNQPGSTRRNAIDAIVGQLAQLRRC